MRHNYVYVTVKICGMTTAQADDLDAALQAKPINPPWTLFGGNPEVIDGLYSELKGFDGGFNDGSWIYLTPNIHRGFACRVPFTSTPGLEAVWQWGYNGKGALKVGWFSMMDPPTGMSPLKGFRGGFSPEHGWAYYAPFGRGGVHHGWATRVIPLDNPSNWPGLRLWHGAPNGWHTEDKFGALEYFDLGDADDTLIGFAGAFTDYRFAYYVPNEGEGSAFHGHMARVDLEDFTRLGVTTLDLAAADAELVGFAGGFTDGEYGYVVPSAYTKAARVPVVKHALPALPRWTSPEYLPPLPEDYRDDLEDFTRRLAEEAAADRPRELDEDE